MRVNRSGVYSSGGEKGNPGESVGPLRTLVPYFNLKCYVTSSNMSCTFTTNKYIPAKILM